MKDYNIVKVTCKLNGLIFLFGGFLFFMSCNQNKIHTVNELKRQDSITNETFKQIDYYKNNYDINAMPKIREFIIKQLNLLDVFHKQKVFIKTQNSIRQIISEYNDSHSISTEESMDENFEKEMNEKGVRIICPEGNCCIEETPDYLYNLFKNRISPELTEYLHYYSIEQKEGFADDAGLIISYDDLYKRIIRWEDFIDRYPNFFIIEDVMKTYSDYLSVFMSGLPNTPIFNYYGELDPEVKELYARISVKNDSRNSTAKITEFYNKLKKNNFRLLTVDDDNNSSSSSNLASSTETNSNNKVLDFEDIKFALLDASQNKCTKILGKPDVYDSFDIWGIQSYMVYYNRVKVDGKIKHLILFIKTPSEGSDEGRSSVWNVLSGSNGETIKSGMLSLKLE